MRKRIAAGVEERGEAMIDEDRARMGVVRSWFNGDGGYGYISPRTEAKRCSCTTRA